MSKNRCYLCGGKLVNGRCRDCGLDNAKSQNKTYRLNQSTLENKIKNQRKEKDTWEQKDYKPNVQKTVSKAGSSNTGGTIPKVKKMKPVDSKKTYKAIGIVIGLIAVLAGPVSDFISDQKAEVVNNYENDAVLVDEYDPYEYVTNELAADGEHFETELEPGKYKVGTHLPEGNYQVFLVEGNGTVTADDYENSIYLWQTIGGDVENDELQEWTDVRLFQGAKLEVQGNLRVRLTTECAQTAKVAAMQENPLNESILLKKGEEVVAGEDFPEGVYDFANAEDWTNVIYQVPLHTDYEDENLDFIYKSVLMTTDGHDSTYRNVVIPAGTIMTAEDADVALVPSEWIETEDYDSYYDDYRH